MKFSLLKPGLLVLAVALVSASASADDSTTDTRLCVKDYILYRMPSANVGRGPAGGGMNQHMWGVKTPGELAINRRCTEGIKLFRGKLMLAEIFAFDDGSSDNPDYGIVIGSTVLMADDDLLPEIRSHTISMQFQSGKILTAGEYVIDVPDGFFTIDGKETKGFVFDDYYIVEAKYTTESPANGTTDATAADLNNFSITYTNSTTIQEGHFKTKWGYDYSSSELCITFNDVDVTGNYAWSFSKSSSGVVINFTTREGMELDGEGELHLTADEGYFLDADEEPLLPLNYKFFVVPDNNNGTTVVNAISDGSDAGERFDLLGRKVTPDSKGIIIRDGRKFINR